MLLQVTETIGVMFGGELRVQQVRKYKTRRIPNCNNLLYLLLLKCILSRIYYFFVHPVAAPFFMDISIFLLEAIP